MRNHRIVHGHAQVDNSRNTVVVSGIAFPDAVAPVARSHYDYTCAVKCNLFHYFGIANKPNCA